MANDPLRNLIRRAEAFRDALVKASAETTSYGKTNGPKQVENNKAVQAFSGSRLLEGLFEEETLNLEEEEEDLKDPGRELITRFEYEHSIDVAEEALLQELFFPASEEVRMLPPDGKHAGGMFIKYSFPGEDEPLFTHDVELQRTVVFGATAHHHITLAQGQHLIEYLEDLDEETSGLRFELWSDVLDVRNKPHAHSDFNSAMPENRHEADQFCSGEEQLDSCIKRREKCIGTATLPMQELLALLKMTFQKRLSLKIRRLFDLPIKFQKWVNLHATWPQLTVQVAYDMIELAANHLLDGTVFCNYGTVPAELHFPFKATLEVLVLEVKDIQAIVHSATLAKHVTIPHIRFTLFPCNRELDCNYPPIMTPLREDAQHVKYTVNMMLDALVIKEMWESYMSFEVWRRVIQAHDKSSSLKDTFFQDDLWVGVAIAPCVMLISRKQGIVGWIDLVGSKKQSVGSLKISVKFLDWQSLSAGTDIEDF